MMSKHLESCSIRMPVSVVGGRGAFPLPSARAATAVVLCPSGPYSRGACYDGSSGTETAELQRRHSSSRGFNQGRLNTPESRQLYFGAFGDQGLI